MRAVNDREEKSQEARTCAAHGGAATRRGQRASIALGALDGHLGYFLRRLQVWVFQDFIRTLAGIDISPAQFSVLAVINANRGLSPAELAANIAIERARLVRLLHRLEQRGAGSGASDPQPTAASTRCSLRRKAARCSGTRRNRWRRDTKSNSSNCSAPLVIACCLRRCTISDKRASSCEPFFHRGGHLQ